MSTRLKALFKNSKSNDNRPATFVIFNKSGLSEQYNNQQKLKQSKSGTKSHRSFKKQIKSQNKRSRKQKFDFDFSDLGRLSLSDTEFEDTIIIDEDRASYNFKAFKPEIIKPIHSVIPTQSLKKSKPQKSNINPIQKFTPKPKVKSNLFDALETSVARKSSVNSMELLNKLHKIHNLATNPALKQNHITKPIRSPKISKAMEPKPKWVAPTIIEEIFVSKQKKKEITPKITEQPAMISEVQKRESLIEIKQKQSEITPKIVTTTIIPDTDDNKEDIEPEPVVNHSYPKSDLWELKGLKNKPNSDDNKENVGQSLSWAIPMSDPNKVKKTKMPKRLTRPLGSKWNNVRNAAKRSNKKPIWK